MSVLTCLNEVLLSTSADVSTMSYGFRPVLSEEVVEKVDQEAEKLLKIDPEGIPFEKKVEALVDSHEEYREYVQGS